MPRPRGKRTRGLALQGLALLALGLLVLPQVPREAEAKEKLVPAAQMQRTDQRGFNWDPTNEGIIRDGTSDCFDNACALQVNQGNFRPNKPPLQTKDGLEFVLQGTVGQIGVTRRLRIDPALGAVRYVEIFENKSKRAVRVSAVVRTVLGSNGNSSMTNTGRAIINGPLQKGETSVFAIQNPRGRPSVIFQVRGARTKAAPIVNVQNNRTFTFTWSVSIPAGRSTAILHSIAQRRFNQPPAAKAMAAEIKPMLDSKWAQGLPGSIRSIISNHSGSAGGVTALTKAAPAHQEVLALAKTYEVERGGDAVVYIERDKPLKGIAEGGTMNVVTRMGEVGVPFADVAVLRGGAGVGRSMRLFLRDGEILAGEVQAPGLIFKTTSGLDIPLDPGGIDALFLPRSAEDGKVADGTEAFLTQLDGTKLSLEKAEDVGVAAVSPWGDLEIPLEAVVRVRYARDPLPGLWILLRDGSRFPLAVRGKAWQLDSRRFGRVEVAPGSIAAWSRHGVAAAVTKSGDDEAVPSRTHAQLVGACFLVGEFDDAKLTVETVAGATPIEVAQIRKIERSDEAEGSVPVFNFQMMSGEAIQGRLEQHLLTFKTPRGTCRIPSLHLWAYRWSPPPAPPAPAKDDAAKEDAATDEAAKDDAAKDEAAKDEAAKDEAAKDNDAKGAAPKADGAQGNRPKVNREKADTPAKDGAAKKDAAAKKAPPKAAPPPKPKKAAAPTKDNR